MFENGVCDAKIVAERDDAQLVLAVLKPIIAGCRSAEVRMEWIKSISDWETDELTK